MTSRTRTPHGPSGERRPAPPSDHSPTGPADRLGWADTPAQLRLALGIAGVGAVLLVLGPLVGLVHGQPDPGYAATPLLILLALAPPALAAGLVHVGRALTGAAVLTGAALLAPGRALADLVFLDDALLAARPEFMVLPDLTPLTPAPGLWLLLAGHLATGVAGVLAVGRAGAEPSDAYAIEFDAATPTLPLGAQRTALVWAVILGTVSAIGLVMPPFSSANAFLLATDLVGAATTPRIGMLLMAVAVLAGCVIGAVAARPAVALGIALGVLAATAAVTLPQIVAGFTVDMVQPAPGPYLALVPLAVFAALVPVLRNLPEWSPNELTLEASRVHLVTGVLGVLTGVAAIIGAVAPQLVVEGLDQPETYANRQLIPAGILVGLLGAALLHRRWAATVRPAFIVSLGAVVLAAASTLDAAFTGSRLSEDVRIGAGAWFTVLAVLLAAASAISGAIAGGTERDDVDTTERTVHLPVAAPVAAAVLFSIGAFGFPMITAPDFVAPGIWTEFRLASWGLVIALAVVVAAAVIATMARPARAAALLLGAAAVVGVHALELPLTGDRTAEVSAGSGTWLSLACCLALLVAAGIASAGPAPEQDEPDRRRR